MLLPRGAVDDLLQALHDQQAAAEAQQAQQMQAPQLAYHGLHLQSSLSQAEIHTQQAADEFHARLHNSFGQAGRHSPTSASPGSRPYGRHTTGL